MMTLLFFVIITIITAYNLNLDEKYDFSSNIVTNNVLQCLNESNIETSPYINDTLHQQVLVMKFNDYLRISDNLLFAEYVFLKDFIHYTMYKHGIDISTFATINNIYSINRYLPKNELLNNINMLFEHLMKSENVYLLTKYTVGLQALHKYAYELIKNDFSLAILQDNLDALITDMDTPFEHNYIINYETSYSEKKMDTNNSKYFQYYDKFFHPHFEFSSKCQHNNFNPFGKNNHYARLEELKTMLIKQL